MAFMFNSFNLNLGKFSVPVPYWQAISIVFLIFVLILTLASFRKHYVDWSLKGGVIGIFFGFLLALILEGFLLIGGKTALTEALGWKNPPAPLAQVLEAGRSQLIQVLGINTQIPSSYAKDAITVQGAMETIQNLNPSDLSKVKNILCSP
ncbi:MAG TPA: hypothetical protein VKC53_02325 [Patescibacteria group bacterium]|nr:hypothetical protein [Patescibacteria group bacterium]